MSLQNRVHVVHCQDSRSVAGVDELPVCEHGSCQYHADDRTPVLPPPAITRRALSARSFIAPFLLEAYPCFVHTSSMSVVQRNRTRCRSVAR